LDRIHRYIHRIGTYIGTGIDSIDRD